MKVSFAFLGAILAVVVGVILTVVGGLLIYLGSPRTVHATIRVAATAATDSAAWLVLVLDDGKGYILTQDDVAPTPDLLQLDLLAQADRNVSVSYRSDETIDHLPSDAQILSSDPNLDTTPFSQTTPFYQIVQLTFLQGDGQSFRTVTTCEYTNTCVNNRYLKRDIGIGLGVAGPLLLISAGGLVISQRRRKRKQAAPGDLLRQPDFPDKAAIEQVVQEDQLRQPLPGAVSSFLSSESTAVSAPIDSSQAVEPTIGTVPPPARKRFFARRGVLIVLIVVLLAALGGGGYTLVKVLSTCTPASSASGPTCVPLPPNTTFVTRPDDHSWDYTVSQTTVDQVISFFQAQLPTKGWRCFNSETLTLTINGVTLSGNDAVGGATLENVDLSIEAGTGDYATLLGVSPFSGDVGLKLSLTPRTGASSSGPCK